MSIIPPKTEVFTVPFRGGTFQIKSDTDPGQVAIIAQIALADPRIDAFYESIGTTLKDLHGNVVFPLPKHPPAPEQVAENEDTGLLDLLALLEEESND